MVDVGAYESEPAPKEAQVLSIWDLQDRKRLKRCDKEKLKDSILFREYFVMLYLAWHWPGE